MPEHGPTDMQEKKFCNSVMHSILAFLLRVLVFIFRGCSFVLPILR